MISFFKYQSNYPLVQNRGKAYLVSAAILGVSLISLAIHGGLKLGVDFTGGTLLQIHFDQPMAADQVRRALADEGLAGAEIQRVRDTERIKNSFLIRTGSKEGAQAADETGPQVLSLSADHNPSAGSAKVTVRARISDAGRGDAMVDSAVCSVEGLEKPLAMVAEPGREPGVFVAVVPTAGLKAGGRQRVTVSGRDANGNWGEAQRIFLFPTGPGKTALAPDQQALAVFTALEDPVPGGAVAAKIVEALQKRHPDNKVTVDSEETVGPKIGQELQWKAFWAVLVGCLLILVYVAFRFDFRFGVAAVAAIFHDVLGTLGFISITGMEFNLQSVAVLLTVIGYSINDSIVVADRIRENVRKPHKESYLELVNRSVNETLSRTVIMVLTVFMVLISLQFFAGRVLSDFTKPLLLGLLIGTYSSIFIVASLVVDWEIKSPSKRKK